MSPNPRKPEVTGGPDRAAIAPSQERAPELGATAAADGLRAPKGALAPYKNLLEAFEAMDPRPSTPSYEVTPSGGIKDAYCIHLAGDAHNVVKHVPRDVAEALQGYLNGKDQSQATAALANFILEKHGTGSAPLRPRFSTELEVVKEIVQGPGRVTNMSYEAVEYAHSLATRGGYQAILTNPKLQTELEDSIDHLLGRRIVDVRNALRREGWSHLGTNESGPLHKGDLKFMVHPLRSPGGNNISAYSVSIRRGKEVLVQVPDLLNQKAADFAEWIEKSIGRHRLPVVDEPRQA